MRDQIPADRLARRADELFRLHQDQIHRRTDRMFAALLLLQWAGSIVAALWLSPSTWSGTARSVHPHVWLAICLGGILSSLPVALACFLPGRAVTRYTISVAQVVFSSLLIHVSGGRIETHFHVFGSLAFLAAYRDWKLLIPPTFVVAADHLVRGMFWPETVFGVIVASHWRWLEHAGWVLFEDTILIVCIRQSIGEMRQTAEQTARLEWNHAALQRNSEELNRLLQKERAIVEGALDALIETDNQGRVTGWNAKAEDIFGWTAAEALGRPIHELIIPEPYRESYLKGLARFRGTGEGPILRRRLELEGLRRNGEVFPIELTVTPVIRGGEMTSCAFVRDITDRKTSEHQLRSAKEQAEAANRAKSEFLANMSHEIRTPLTGILGFTDVLRFGVSSQEDMHDCLSAIHTSGQHLLTLINDILDLSKIEAGKMEFDAQRCSPHAILSDVLSLLRVRAQEKGLRLECHWQTPIPETILSDAARLRQLLMNLVGNAVKFTEKGGVTVRVALEEAAASSHLAFEIEDTGLGIASENLERIFRPFDQADNSITRRFGGTGLGLAISRKIAEGLGGGVSVQSELGRGSVFRVTVTTGPLADVPLLQQQASEALRPERIGTAAQRRADLAGSRILLVEDGETNRDLISLVLEQSGAEMVCATNGLEGVEAARRGRFDVILMDMQMPVMDGYTASTILRRDGILQPIIALTAHAMRGDREKCLAAGCTSYLTKPIQIDALLSEVTAQLCERGGGSCVPSGLGTMGESRAPEPRVRIASTLPVEIPRFRQIVERFLEILPEKHRAMQSAVDQADWPAVAQLAHWLKGTGGTVGFECFTEPALRLEEAAREKVADRVLDSLRQIESLVESIALTTC